MRFLVLLLLVLSPRAFGEAASEIEWTERVLEAGSERFLAALERVDEEQWNFRVPSIPHTIAEEAEHIALAENDLRTVIEKALEVEPSEGLSERLAGKDEIIREILLGDKAVAESYKSPGRLTTHAEVLEHYSQAHERLLELLRTAEAPDLRGARHPNPKIGPLTALQWFRYIAYHRERHVRQIEEILSHPDLPGATFVAGNLPRVSPSL